MQMEFVIVDTEAACLAELVKECGLRVHAAHTLEDAIEVLNSVKPFMISIEEQLPAKNGNLYGALLAQACQIVFGNARIIGLCNEFNSDFYRYCDAVIAKKGDYQSSYKKVVKEFSNAANKPVS